MIITEVHAILDEAISAHPSTQGRLNSNANIILHSTFESAIKKIQDHNEANLTSVELKTVSILLKSKARPTQTIKGYTLLQRSLKRQRTEKINCHRIFIYVFSN